MTAGARERIAVRSLELYYVRPRWQLLRVTTDAGVEGMERGCCDGMIAAPAGPGLGVSINLGEVKARQCDGSWRSPSLSYGDGSVANW